MKFHETGLSLLKFQSGVTTVTTGTTMRGPPNRDSGTPIAIAAPLGRQNQQHCLSLPSCIDSVCLPHHTTTGVHP